MSVAPDTVTLYGPDGEPTDLPHEPISDDELRLLLLYKKFLLKHGYREALYCNNCWNRQDLNDGTRASVQDNGLTIEAMIKCRCRVAFGRGSGLTS